MRTGLTNLRIAGVAVFLFFSILLGVGIHHLVATGTCSSTGYAGDLGPVPTCPSGTGWWILFVMAGIFGALIGGGMATSGTLIFSGIFGGIGIGALTLLFDSQRSTGQHLFAGIFGGAFALVGLGAAAMLARSAVGSLGAGGSHESGAASPSAASGAHEEERSKDPILAAYQGSGSGTVGLAGLSGGFTAPQGLAGGSTAAGLSGGSNVAGPSGGFPRPAVDRSEMADQLGKLAELRRSGALSESEFEAAKARLIGGS